MRGKINREGEREKRERQSRMRDIQLQLHRINMMSTVWYHIPIINSLIILVNFDFKSSIYISTIIG